MPLTSRSTGPAPTEVACPFTCSVCRFEGPALVTVEPKAGGQLQLESLPVESRTYESARHLAALAVCPRCGRRSPGAVVAFTLKLVAFVLLPLWGLGWLLLDRLGLEPRTLGASGQVAAVVGSVAVLAFPLVRSLGRARRRVSFD